MNVGIIGHGATAQARRRVLQDLPEVSFAGMLAGEACTVEAFVGPGVVAASPMDVFLAGLDAAFITVPTADHFLAAEAATKQGVHVFLEWPPARSVAECEALVQLAEESGVEAGVSRPLRFLPVFEAMPKERRCALVLLDLRVPAAAEVPPGWSHWLGDAVDLCCALAQSVSVQRIDAETVRDGAWPTAVAFGLRFHNGTYAQVSLRRADTAGGTLYVAGPDLEQEVTVPMPPPPTLLAAESRAFLRALAADLPPPVSVLDGLHTLRLVERLMAKLR